MKKDYIEPMNRVCEMDSFSLICQSLRRGRLEDDEKPEQDGDGIIWADVKGQRGYDNEW